MYTIYADGEVLYSPLLANEGYGVISPKITMELNKAGSLNFTMPPNNVMYAKLKKLKSIVTVEEDGREIFRGRVLNDKKDFYNRKKVYVEGELSFLIDSPTRPYSYQGDIQGLFKRLINNHNNSVDKEQRFEVGYITVTDNNNYINRSNSDYSDTWSQIKDKLIKTHGGYIRVRLDNGIRYIDYLEEYMELSGQIIQFGENLLDITEYITAENVFTCLIPLGADDEEKGRLTIKSVNNGKDYIIDEDAVKLFGKIWKTNTWDDVTLPSNLISKGYKYLRSGIEMAVTLEMKAVDMHLLNVETESIKLGTKVRVISLPHDIDKYFQCSKISLDLVSPDKSTYTLGVAYSTITEKQSSTIQSVNMSQSAVSTVQSAAVNAQTIATSAQSSAENAKTVADKAAVTVSEFQKKVDEFPDTYLTKENLKKTGFIDYSQEIVIGKWIDGSKLYQKIIRGKFSDESDNVTGQDESFISINIDGKVIIVVNGWVSSSEDFIKDNIPIGYSDTSNIVSSYISENNLLIKNTLKDKYPYYITVVQYTKA